MKKILTTISIIFYCLMGNSQELQFSQYYAASLYLNPGFNGIYNSSSLHLNHKRQLQTGDIVNEITQVSLVFPIKAKGSFEQPIGGFGLMAFNEKRGFQGIDETNSVFLNYAHNLKFGLLNSYLVSIGVQAGYRIRGFEIGNLQWGSQYNEFFGWDDTLPAPVDEFNNRKENVILNAGIMYYYNPERNYLLYQYSGFMGFSATNLNRPNTSFTQNEENTDPIQLKYHGGIEFKLKKVYVTPSILFLYLAENYQYNAGLNFVYAPDADEFNLSGPQLLMGTWYRYRDSFIFMGGVKINQLTVRASYDMNSKLFLPETVVNFTQPSMEISLQYNFSSKDSFKKASNPLF